jgi:hypothetical protein
MSTHEDYYWTAGDDWQINATLLDYAGAPFNLSGTPDVRWSLVTELGETVLTEADIAIVVIDGPAGRCAIQVPAVKTTDLAEGRYTDMIRIVSGGVTSTLSHGLNWISADPWAA